MARRAVATSHVACRVGLALVLTACAIGGAAANERTRGEQQPAVPAPFDVTGFDGLWREVLAQELPTFQRLNGVVEKSGERVEGNLFYKHDSALTAGDSYADSTLDMESEHKRSLYVGLTRRANRMLEIGFNAGHSALLAMSTNPKLHYHAFDLCEHKYTKPAFELLSAKFPGRMKLTCGNSLVTLKYFEIERFNTGASFDLLHVDGGHGRQNMIFDMLNVRMLAEEDHVILCDDADSSTYIRKEWENMADAGLLQHYGYSNKVHPGPNRLHESAYGKFVLTIGKDGPAPAGCEAVPAAPAAAATEDVAEVLHDVQETTEELKNVIKGLKQELHEAHKEPRRAQGHKPYHTTRTAE